MSELGYQSSIPQTWEFGSQTFTSLVRLLVEGEIYRLCHDGKSLQSLQKTLENVAAKLPTFVDTCVLSSEVAQVLQNIDASNPSSLPLPMNGNIWIVKPVGLSCGQSITVCYGMKDVLKSLLAFQGRCVVQRYIERPLLVKNNTFKFDIRQWVLIRNISPLEVFFFSEFYIRVSSKPFSLATESLVDPLVHLTNFAVQCHASTEDSSVGESDLMMSESDFRDEFETKFSAPAFKLLKEKIRLVCLQGVKSGVSQLMECNGAFEWLGFDVMIDSDLNAYLIEANTSPDISYSTSITRRLVEAAMTSIIPLVLRDQSAIEPECGTSDTCSECLAGSLHWCRFCDFEDQSSVHPDTLIQSQLMNRNVYWKKSWLPPFLGVAHALVDAFETVPERNMTEEDESEDEI